MLCVDKERLTYTVLKAQKQLGTKDNLVMEVPSHTSLENLSELSMDRASWSGYVMSIPHFW